MSHNSGYHRNGTHARSYPPTLTAISSSDSGQIYGATRGMGPPPMDLLPQPVEIDVDLNISRTLPSPATTVPNAWDANYPHGFGEGPYGSSNMARLQQQSHDNPTRGPIQNPLAIWYSDNDGPWVPKVIPAGTPEEGNDSRKRGNNRSLISYGSSYRQPNPSDAGSLPFAVPNSDSGYGTRRSIGNASVFSADAPERDQDCHSLTGHLENFQPFPSFTEVAVLRDSRLHDTWSSPSIVGQADSHTLICPGCNKAVKTQSELKKHDLRHKKPYKCQVAGCTRFEGFSTTNDLERHTKSKHAASVSGKKYRCSVPGCKSREKAWPRLDNFRSHLKRVHQNQLRTDEDFDEILRNAEFWEGAEIDVNETLHFPQTVPQDSPSTAELAGKGITWKPPQLDWSGASPNAINFPQLQMDPRLPGLEHSQDKLIFKEAPTPSHVPPCSTTIEPLEVCQLPARDPGNRFTVASVLSPQVPPESATSISHIINSEPVSSPITEGNTSKQAGSFAPDEALTKALKNVLSASIAREPATKETVRSVLPNGRPAPSSSSDCNSLPAVVSKTSETDAVKDSDTPPSDAEINASEAHGKVVEEIVKTIHNFGYILQDDSRENSNTNPIILNLGSLAGKKSDKQVICALCKKFRGRPCELKKHMKRHDRPYGCTFLACGKKFGSKNDWKRHEGSQHFQIETWRCDGERLEGGACSKVFYRKQSFQEHLKKDHRISDDDQIVNEKLETCRIGRNCQDRFWCGFCVKLIGLKKRGLDAWTERFDHIDDHFMGRGHRAKEGIQDWIPVDGSEKVNDIRSNSDSKPKSESSDSGSSSSGSSPSTSTGPPTNAIVRPTAKRPRPDEEGSQSRKRPRSMNVIVICCQCNLQNNPVLSDSCTNCSSGHAWCSNCHTEYPDEEDRSPPHVIT